MQLTLNLEKRDEHGKNQVSKIRQQDMIPGVMYSADDQAESVKVPEKEFNRVFREAGTSNMITLKIGNDEKKAIIKEVQKHPYKSQILHIDFQLLNMNEKIKLTVPVILHDRDNIRLQPSILIQVLDEIEIECLPLDIPSNGAEVSVMDMNFDTPMYVKDLDIFSNDKITILRDPDEVVATLNHPAMENELEPEEDEEVHEVEVITEKKDEQESED